MNQVSNSKQSMLGQMATHASPLIIRGMDGGMTGKGLSKRVSAVRQNKGAAHSRRGCSSIAWGDSGGSCSSIAWSN